MMTIWNVGEIEMNKPATEEVAKIINDVLEAGCSEAGSEIISIGEKRDYYDSEIAWTLAEVIEKVEPLGYVLNGSVSYYGDHEGRVDVIENGVHQIPIEDFGLNDADDKTLIDMLVARGYTVTKNEDGKLICWQPEDTRSRRTRMENDDDGRKEQAAY